jgi:hypothetical protein
MVWVGLVCEKETLKIDNLATLGVELPTSCRMASRGSFSLCCVSIATLCIELRATNSFFASRGSYGVTRLVRRYEAVLRFIRDVLALG